MPALDDLQSERDALAVLGLLAHAGLTWDPPVLAGQYNGKPDYTHFVGLNIHALVIDNTDGEVLAIARNRIHESADPTRHAEPAAIDAALGRLHEKRPRKAGTSIEAYYRTELLYAPGSAPADFLEHGCTLYTTLEPCPMCAARLCVARMKRTAFLIQDCKFGGSFPTLLQRYYPMFALAYGPCSIVGGSAAATKAAPIVATLAACVDQQRANGVQDIWFLDSATTVLGQAIAALAGLAMDAVSDSRNQRMLGDLKRLCRLPG